MKYYTRYMKNKNGTMYAVAEDDAEYNVKPYCVMAYKEGQGFTQQVSKWYMHKGWAIRAWNKIIKG